MCTLTYLPTPEGGFILTSNRDELPGRSPVSPPASYAHGNAALIYAKDPKAGGTWLAAADNGFALCLLNGAFQKHQPMPPYRKSRGMVIPDFFEYADVHAFMKGYVFEGIEPFTLIIVHKKEQVVLHELKWDGGQLHHEVKPEHKSHIWSSVTLYTPEVIAEREKWFNDFLLIHTQPHLHDMLHFHHFGGSGDRNNSLVMNRENQIRTLSISSIKHCVGGYFMVYEDLLQQRYHIEPIHYKESA